MFGNTTPAAVAGAVVPVTSAPAAASDPFAQVGVATPMEGGIYAEPGIYPALWINALKMIQNRKGAWLFIAELDILRSDVELRPAGTKMSWAPSFAHDATAGNVRDFLAKLMGAPLEQVDADATRTAVSEANPCFGRIIRLEATGIITKGNKQPFTVHNWSNIPAEGQAQAAQLRAEAGF